MWETRYHQAFQHLAAQMENEWTKCKLDVLTSKDGLFPSQDWVMGGMPELVELDAADWTLKHRKENPFSHGQSRGFSKLRWDVARAACEHSCGTALLTDVLKIVLAGPLEMECTYGTSCNQTLSAQYRLITSFFTPRLNLSNWLYGTRSLAMFHTPGKSVRMELGFRLITTKIITVSLRAVNFSS